MSDEWRVEVDLDDEQHGLKLGERLRSLDLDDEAKERLGDRVIVTRDGSRMFLYARSDQESREAERVARDLVADEGLSAEIAVTRWHPDADAWKDAAEPMPETDAEHAAEHHQHEEEAEAEPRPRWAYEWEVRIDLPSRHETVALAARLEDEGIEVRRHWKYLLVGAASEERVNELAERIKGEAPEGSTVQVVTAGAPHPVFVFLGAHTPGIARDLGA